MSTIFDRQFAKRLHELEISLLPRLKGGILFEEHPAGKQISPEPDSPKGYAPGDDVRYIDWHLYARLDRLFLKSMVREEELQVFLLPDCSGSMIVPSEEKLRTTFYVTAALAGIYLAMGHRVSILPWAKKIQTSFGPFAGSRELPKIFKLLSPIKGRGLTNLRTAGIETMGMTDRKTGIAILISDFLFPIDYRPTINQLAAWARKTAAIQIVDEEEISFQLRGNFIFTDPETGRKKKISASYRTLKTYQELMADHLDQVQSFFKKTTGSFLRASAGDLFESIVRRYFAEAVAGRP